MVVDAAVLARRGPSHTVAPGGGDWWCFSPLVYVAFTFFKMLIKKKNKVQKPNLKNPIEESKLKKPNKTRSRAF